MRTEVVEKGKTIWCGTRNPASPSQVLGKPFHPGWQLTLCALPQTTLLCLQPAGLRYPRHPPQAANCSPSHLSTGHTLSGGQCHLQPCQQQISQGSSFGMHRTPDDRDIVRHKTVIQLCIYNRYQLAYTEWGACAEEEMVSEKGQTVLVFVEFYNPGCNKIGLCRHYSENHTNQGNIKTVVIWLQILNK